MLRTMLIFIGISTAAIASETKTGGALFGTESSEGLLLIDGEAAKEMYGFLTAREEEVTSGVSLKEGKGIRCSLEIEKNRSLCTISLIPLGILRPL